MWLQQRAEWNDLWRCDNEVVERMKRSFVVSTEMNRILCFDGHRGQLSRLMISYLDNLTGTYEKSTVLFAEGRLGLFVSCCLWLIGHCCCCCCVDPEIMLSVIWCVWMMKIIRKRVCNSLPCSRSRESWHFSDHDHGACATVFTVVTPMWFLKSLVETSGKKKEKHLFFSVEPGLWTK